MFPSARGWLGVLLLVAAPARAAELTDVASSFDEDNPFDFRLRVGFYHDEKTASLKREGELPGQDGIVNYKDLLYGHTRDEMRLRAEVGLFQDLGLHLELPIVLNDTREYRFDQSLGSACVYPGQGGGTVNCVNASNSSTVRDGILPAAGYDALSGGAGFNPGSGLAFRGPKRGGSGLEAFDTLNLGLTWAALSQKRDDSKPTWVLGVEGRFSFGQIMRFDRAHPDANHGVSDGLHRLLFSTALSRRFRHVEPYAGFWYMLPFAREGSLFVDYGPAQKNKDPQQSAGAVFGFEGIPYERADHAYKVAIDLRGRIDAKFDGRGYSEAWELLASAPPLACDARWNPACDPATAPANAYHRDPAFNGLTTIDNYASIGADIALVLQLSKYARVNIGLQYTHDQGHIITADDVGQAFDPGKGDGCSVPTAGRVTRPCEFNPSYRPVVDQVGRRFRIEGADLFRVGGWAQVMF